MDKFGVLNKLKRVTRVSHAREIKSLRKECAAAKLKRGFDATSYLYCTSHSFSLASSRKRKLLGFNKLCNLKAQR